MAISVRGKTGKQLAKLERDAANARTRVREAERAFSAAKNETTELDARLARLEGQQMAGNAVEEEITSATKALREARERCDDERQRELIVLREAQTAYEQKVVNFIRENRDELEAALREEAEEVVRQVEEHVIAALSSREQWMAVYQSFSEMLGVTDGHTQALPSADGAISYFRDLARFAENSLRVPAPRLEEGVAA